MSKALLAGDLPQHWFSFISRKIRLILVFALMPFALVGPHQATVPAANATGNSTVEFQVKGHDDANLQGATIAISYYTIIGGTSTPIYDSALTNSSGSVTFQVPADASELRYIANPAPTDLLNAISVDYMGNVTKSFSFSATPIQVKFAKSDLRLVLKKSNGTTDANYGLISPRAPGRPSLWASVVRPGPINLSFSDARAQTISPSQLRIWNFDLLSLEGFTYTDDFPWEFGLTKEASGDFLVFMDRQKTGEVPKSSGVPVLAFSPSNLVITMKDSAGNPYRFPGYGSKPNSTLGQGGMRVFRVDSEGSELFIDSVGSSSYSVPDVTGRALARLKGAAAGKYVIAYQNNGGWDFPTMQLPIWVDANGGIALTESGSYSQAFPIQVELRAPSSSNFKYKLLDVSGDLISGSVTFSSKSRKWSTNEYTSSGKGLINLVADEYVLTANTDEGSSSVYNLNMLGSTPVLTKQQGAIQVLPSETDDAFALRESEPNVRFRAVNPDSSSQVVASSFSVYNKAANFYQGSKTGDFAIPDGTGYQLVINPFDRSLYGSKNITFSVTNGQAVVTGITPTTGIHNVTLVKNNFLFKLINPSDSSIVNGWIEACKIVDGIVSSCDSHTDTIDGLGGLVLSDGSYRITANPYSEYPFSFKTITVTVSGNTITAPSTTLNAGRFEITFDAPNISGYLHSSISDTRITVGWSEDYRFDVTGVSLQLQRKMKDVYWEWTRWSSWRNNSLFGFNVSEAGEYRIIARPFGSKDLTYTISETFTVTNDGKVSRGGGSPQNSISNFVIRLETPNVTFKVVDDQTSTLLNGDYIYLSQETDYGTWGITDIQIMNGVAKSRLTPGKYLLDVYPPQNDEAIDGLTKQRFNAEVASNGTISVKYGGAAVSQDTSNAFVLRMQKGNLRGRIVDIQGQPVTCGNNRWVNVQLQKQDPFSLNWNWSDWISFNCSTARFNHRITEPGKYRLKLEPQGFATESIGYSSETTVTTSDITSGNAFDFGDVKLGTPSIRVAVTTQSSADRLQWVGISIQQEGQWIDWVNTGSNGVANIGLPSAGNYTFDLHPNDVARELGATRKSYSISATVNGAGQVTAVAQSSAGVSISSVDNVTVLTLGVPNLKGTVHAPDSPTVMIRDAQVIPFDVSTNRELWEYSTNADWQGRWSMSLPSGSYRLQARAPGGNVLYANSKWIGTITVDSVGVVTLTDSAATGSRTALEFAIGLSNPRWSGQVFQPDTNGIDSTIPIEYPWVCLYSNERWTCASGDREGRWALSPDYEFQDFSDYSLLDVNDNYRREYPLLRFEGKTAVSNALGGSSAQNRRLEMRATNLNVEVRAGGSVVPFTWVYIDRYLAGLGWLGGSSTNSQGIAKFALADLRESITVTVDVNDKALSSDYVRTVRTVAGSALDSLTVVINLDTPNVRGVLREPNADPSAGEPVPWSWLNVYNETKNFWVTGASTDSQGRFALNLEKPSNGSASLQYTITAYPSWNSTGDSTFQRFTAVVDSTGSIDLKIKDQMGSLPTEVSNGVTRYIFSLRAPSIAGTVVKPDSTPAVNSWILPIESQKKQWLWEQATYSRFDGKFSINVPDGVYDLQARKPWNEKNYSDSAFCRVTVSGGQVDTAPSCIDSSSTTKKIKLTLREPNVKFKLVANDNSPISGAYVSAGYGSWHTWANSSEDGTVSLFIDPEAISLLNPWMSETRIAFYIWVSPPWGSTAGNMVPWGCSVDEETKPICKELDAATVGTTYPVRDLGEIKVLGPNVTLKIKKPGGTEKASFNTWVNVYEKVQGCDLCRNWVAGANVDPNGNAVVNVSEVAGKRFYVEIWPSWEDRNIYANKLHDNAKSGYSKDELNSLSSQFTLGSPNLNIKILAPMSSGGAASKWAWATIEVIDSATSNTLYWYRGLQMDAQGRGAVLVEPSLAYRLSVYPGNGQAGSTTQCVFFTNETGTATTDPARCWGETITATTLELNLSSGNVAGVVKNESGLALAGVVVYANYQETTTTSVVATTDSEGRFGLELGVGKDWTITVIPLTNDGSVSPYRNETRTVTSAQLLDKQSKNQVLVLADVTLSRR